MTSIMPGGLVLGKYQTHLVLHPLLVVKLHILLMLSARAMSLPDALGKRNIRLASQVAIGFKLFMNWVHVG